MAGPASLSFPLLACLTLHLTLSSLSSHFLGPPFPVCLQLLRIEEELGADAVYAGENYRHFPIA